jgi:dolichol-phosphate mannosyltransferase
MMDSDMQHPPELISELLSTHESGYEIVHAVRYSPKNNNCIDRFLSRMFYKCINLVSDVNTLEGAADFRLISKRICDIFRNNIRERDQFLRGLFVWVGFKQCSVPYFANKRLSGETKYNLFRKIDFALTGIISFNIRPIKILTTFGFILSMGSLLFGLFICIAYILGDHFPQGWSTIVVVISFFGGIQFFFLGIICQYLASIYNEVKNRPIYIIESMTNF